VLEGEVLELERPSAEQSEHRDDLPISEALGEHKGEHKGERLDEVVSVDQRPPPQPVLHSPSSPWLERASEPPVSHAALNTAPYEMGLFVRLGQLALFATRGPLRGDVYLVTESPAIVGRGEGSDCQLPPMDDTSISRSHCQLRRKNNMAWEIKCLSSGNLYVNDMLIQEGETQTIYDKDTLMMGRSTFSVRLGPISPEEHKGEQKKAREPHAASRKGSKGRSYGAD